MPNSWHSNSKENGPLLPSASIQWRTSLFGHLGNTDRASRRHFCGLGCYNCGMSNTPVGRSLRALKNISWLTRRQVHRLVGALTVSRLAKGSIIFDERNSTDSVY